MCPSVAAVALLLVASPFFFLRAGAHADPSLCCFDFQKRPIPLNLLAGYEYTNAKCPHPAVIFITVGKRRLCADPQEGWAKQRIRSLPSPTD